MIRIITFLTRKQGLTHQEFLDHWHGHHGPLLARLSGGEHIRRYEQHPTLWPSAGSSQPEPRYDGVAIQWFDDIESFQAMMRDPEQDEHRADIDRFLDASQLRWVICDDPVVVIDGDVTDR
jgi:uncharacterized protein (TIGR02118 family)